MTTDERQEAKRIHMAWSEVMMAAHVGVMRQVASLRDGRKDKHGFTGDGWDIHCAGACGELAVAMALGIYWSASVDTFKTPDLGANIQVRTRSRGDYELLVRDDDDDASRYVLVTGRPPSYMVHGWMFGHEAKQMQWRKSHGNREEAFFVPQKELRSLETLLENTPEASGAGFDPNQDEDLVT